MIRDVIAVSVMSLMVTAGCAGRTSEAVGTNSAASPWERARLRGVEFRAVGQEPGWVVEIDQGRTLLYNGDYGDTRLLVPAPAPTAAATGAAVYTASTALGDLVVDISETDCADTMSGERFTHTVSVVLAGRTLQGCGRVLMTADADGVYWRLSAVNGIETLGPAGDREAWLRLSRDSARATGFAGCNTFRGKYEMDGGRIAFGPLAMTRMACLDPALGAEEDALVRALASADSFNVGNGRLTLFDDARSVARFTAEYLR
jgi:heat shock protein HslJ/uncharacterized membrane protein